MYNNVIIYYFSGTGNSRNVALWISEAAAEISIPCEIQNIALLNRMNPEPPPGSLIIILSPVHGFNYPPVMLNFIARFPKGHNKVLLMCTRAGMLIGNFNLPGISGMAFYLSALIFWLKGYSIAGMIPVDLPSNWISLHPGLNQRTIDILHRKNFIKVTHYATDILAGKKIWRGLKDIIQDLIVMPVSPGYYLVGRFFFSKSFFASADCNNCDICTKGCPVRGIIKVDNRPFWTFRCESCMKCIGNCPKKAIQAGHGFIIGYIILSSVITGTLLYYFNQYLFPIESGFIRLLVDSGISLFFLGIAYRLIHYLMRFRFFERLMVYTSLTKYKFWGKPYKAIQ